MPIKLKKPIKAKYEDAITIPTLLSAQNGIKCWPTIPVLVSPQMKKVMVKIQKAGLLTAPARALKDIVIALPGFSAGGS